MFCEILTERTYTAEGGDYLLYSAKRVNKEEYFFIAGKGEFYAHSEDLKGAIADVQFKAMAEKLKKEPINPDTVITVNHYRLLTGACEFGVRSWMKENGLEDKKEITAKELLPILKKSNAYGFERFKQLITF